MFGCALTLWYSQNVHDGATVRTLDHVPMGIIVYPSKVMDVCDIVGMREIEDMHEGMSESSVRIIAYPRCGGSSMKIRM